MDSAFESFVDLPLLPKAALCGIYVFSIDDNLPTYANHAYTTITGWELAEVQARAGGRFFELFHPDDRDSVRKHVSELVSSPIGQAIEITYRFLHKDGHWIWCRSRNLLSEQKPDGSGCRMLGTFVDISDEKTLEHELSESQERLSLAIEAGEIGIWDWNLQGGQSTNDRRVHQQFDMDWGGTNEADDWFDRIHEDDRAAVRATVAASIAGSGEYHARYRVQWRDGSIHHLIAKGMVIRDANGVAQRLLGMNFDVTEQVQLQQRMEQRQKMEAIGQLAGGIAHDFNNQLMAVHGNAELLRRQLAEPKHLRYLESILVAANRSADLTRQLLNYARQGVTRQVRFDVVRVIHEVADILKHTIDKRIRVQFDLCTDQAWIEGDETNLQNALLNLALNARDAMPDGGLLTIATTTVDLEGGLPGGQLADLKSGRYLCISVIDTGRGIPPGLLGRIREPFFTTKETGSGTGLGLPAADGIIQRHGGALAIESEVGRGTRMTMYLPFPMLADQSVVALEPEPIENERLSLLVIDDEIFLLELIEAMLQVDGHHTHCESDPMVGIAYFTAHWRALDVVVLDMTMPQLDGTETFRRLRAIDPDIPVLIVSGHSPEGAVDRLLASGRVVFLQKPFSIAELRLRLLELTNQARKTRG